MKHKLLVILAILLIAGNTASYTLCDSVDRDSGTGFFRCNINSSQMEFKQTDIDLFWNELQADGDYANGRIATVEWEIKSAVIQIADDLRFAQPAGVNVAWDFVIEGDANTTHDINSSLAGVIVRSGNQSAIKKKLGAMQEYFISFAPMEGRRGVRNITIENPVGAFAAYISGSHIKKMVMELEGDLEIDGGYIENLAPKQRRIYSKS